MAWFRYGGNYTIYSRSGRVRLKFTEDTDMFIGISNNLLLFKSANSKYYVKNIEGKEVFHILFKRSEVKNIHRLKNNLYLVGNHNDEYYIADSMGRIEVEVSVPITALVQRNMEVLHNAGFFVVENIHYKLYGVISRDGRTIIDQKFSFIGERDGNIFCCVDTSQRAYFIDTSGKVLLEVTNLVSYNMIIYSQLTIKQPIGYRDSLCLGIEDQFNNRRFFYFDATGKKKFYLGSEIVWVANFCEGLAPVADSSGNLGFINTKGELVIGRKYKLVLEGGYPIPFILIPEFRGGYAYLAGHNGYISQNRVPFFKDKHTIKPPILSH